MSQAKPPTSADDLAHGRPDHAAAVNGPNKGPSPGGDRPAQGEASLPGTSPRDPNPPADTAPTGPTTAYEYARGDRGAAATEHERQVRESEAGPSRDDVARNG
jgi:hypothetical protein